MKDIGFIGGEPTMHPQLFDLIRFASDLDLKVTLYTNGRRLSDSEYVRKLKRSGVYIVQIDIQSTNPKKHDSVTQVNGSYRDSVKGIENCHKHGLKLRLLTVLCYKDFKTYKGIIDKFAYMKTMFVFFREIPPINKLSKQKVLSNKETAKLVEKIYGYSKKKKVLTSFYIRMPMCWLNKSFANGMIKDSAFENLCHMMDGNSLIIDVNGKVLPCVHFVGYHIFNITKNGKLLSKEELLKKWNSKRIYKMRTKLRGYPSKECMNCSHYGMYCRGGCPLIKFKLGPYWKQYQVSSIINQ